MSYFKPVRKEARSTGAILKRSNQLVALGKRVPSEDFLPKVFPGWARVMRNFHSVYIGKLSSIWGKFP